VERDVLVIGGGISGLTAAWEVVRRCPGVSIEVLEASDRVGGTAQTLVSAGLQLDTGPNGFLTNVPDTLDLVRELGASGELLAAHDHAARRYLLRREGLVALPTGPGAMLSTHLVGWRAKLRLLREPFVAPLPRGDEESVWQFGARRVGADFADAFLAPMVLGITAGDARATSLDALFPRMRAMEQEHGSLVRALVARRRASRRAPQLAGATIGPAGPAGSLTTFRTGGMGRLPDLLAASLGERVRPRAHVEQVTRAADGRWHVVTVDGSIRVARQLVVAVPAWEAARLLRPTSEPLADIAAAIPYADVRVVALAYQASRVGRALDGFGFLVPRGHGYRLLGCLWTSSIFPHQAPDGTVLLRCVTGGVHEPAAVAAPEQASVTDVIGELRAVLGLEGEPLRSDVFTWRRGIPQYTLGHLSRLRDAEQTERSVGALHLTGNAWRGVGVNDCVRDGRRVGRAVAERLGH
jgi:oxygen-dependent protoporphyrinogen oxidase